MAKTKGNLKGKSKPKKKSHKKSDGNELGFCPQYTLLLTGNYVMISVEKLGELLRKIVREELD